MRDKFDKRLNIDLKCNYPVLVHNKLNADMEMCNTTEDFLTGKIGGIRLYP